MNRTMKASREIFPLYEFPGEFRHAIYCKLVAKASFVVAIRYPSIGGLCSLTCAMEISYERVRNPLLNPLIHSICHTSRSTRKEVSLIFWSSNGFNVNGYERCFRKTRFLDEAAYANLQDICLMRLELEKKRLVTELPRFGNLK